MQEVGRSSDSSGRMYKYYQTETGSLISKEYFEPRFVWKIESINNKKEFLILWDSEKNEEVKRFVNATSKFSEFVYKKCKNGTWLLSEQDQKEMRDF